MSGVSDLYDGIDSILSTVYPSTTYKELVYSTFVELNDFISLNRGYGFNIGAKEGVSLTTGRYQQFSAEIQIVNTIVNRGTDRDLSIKKLAEKTLLEDQFLLLDYLRTNTASIAKVWVLEYLGDNGIEPVFPDKANYVMIRTSLRAVFAEAC